MKEQHLKLIEGKKPKELERLIDFIEDSIHRTEEENIVINKQAYLEDMYALKRQAQIEYINKTGSSYYEKAKRQELKKYQ
ncbi:MAG: hypothetical protein ACOC5T_06590 [Elusimicrobiota bacterium]